MSAEVGFATIISREEGLEGVTRSSFIRTGPLRGLGEWKNNPRTAGQFGCMKRVEGNRVRVHKTVLLQNCVDRRFTHRYEDVRCHGSEFGIENRLQLVSVPGRLPTFLGAGQTIREEEVRRLIAMEKTDSL